MPDTTRKARSMWQSRQRAQFAKDFRRMFPGAPFVVQIRDHTGTLTAVVTAAKVECVDGQLVVTADPSASALFAMH